ncbi:MAG TPA: NAD-dependent epimerase/dehydratase family protein [Methanoregula sp.]|nr:NAD-dependent epimerase/dehydratase family protein [Methanoregula sp.]
MRGKSSTGSVLVTGGAGFIGSHIARRLLDTGYDVTILDNMATGEEGKIPDGAKFIGCDISRKKTYRDLGDRTFSCVLHLAAQSSGEISNERPEFDLEVNTLGTLLLLRWCMKQKIPRFLYASSMAVYGDTEKNPVAETDPCAPLSFYGISKFASEQYIRHFAAKGLKTTIFRMFSVYGPGQNMANMKQGMVSIFMAYLMKNEEIWVKGSRDRFRDFVYIDDVAEAWIAAVDNPASYGKTYNLATGRKTHVHELITEEIKTFRQDPMTYPVRYEGTTPADQFGLYADITRIRSDLGWEPKTDLRIGLERMAGWVQKEFPQ